LPDVGLNENVRFQISDGLQTYILEIFEKALVTKVGKGELNLRGLHFPHAK
jgi:hypothetical protein